MLKHFPIFCWFCLFLSFFSLARGNSLRNAQENQIIFLINQGEHQQAVKLYQSLFQAENKHDYELLHRLGLALLDHGFRQSDPEIQLLTLFGANISAHKDAYYILEESLKSRYPEIQVIALGALSQIQEDRADQALLKALGFPHLLVRFEAIKYLCKKKHVQAVDQAEALMYKTPQVLLPAYPSLFACVGGPKAIRILNKLMNDPAEKVRSAVILSVARYKREELLPKIRQQALHYQFMQQEACAYALGMLKDNHSLEKLQKLAHSQYPSVALAANWALCQLSQFSAIQSIEKMAKQENVFAISILGNLSEQSTVLRELVSHSNMQVRFNALLALLEQRQQVALKNVAEIIIRDRRDLGFVVLESPGKALKAWKVVSGASELLKEDLEAYRTHLELKEEVLQKVREISKTEFLKIAALIFASQQNDLIPKTVSLLEEIETEDTIQCLKQHQQKLGAPLVRNYCNLALYRLGEPGPYGDQLRQWVKSHNQTDLIQFRAYDPWKVSATPQDLTPVDSSRLLIEAFEAFAAQQDKEGIELLLEVIATGHPKNKYALAGILLRATQ